jgi:hypothetical protein
MLLLWNTTPGGAANRAKPSPEVEVEYHSMVPMGMEIFAVRPWHGGLTLMALAENPEFEGWRRLQAGDQTSLVAADGRPIEQYPGQISFRVNQHARQVG